MNKKIGMLIIATMLLIGFLPIGVQAANEPSIYLYFNGGTDRYLNITVGDTFNFSEYVDQDGDDLQGAKVTVNFTTYMNVTSVEEGPNNLWGSTFLTLGTITNDTGDGTGSVNYTQNGIDCQTTDGEIARINAIGDTVGTATINWTYVELEDCDTNVLTVYQYNSTVYIHPAYITGTSATAVNETDINITWTFQPYEGADRFVIFGNSTSSPTGRDAGDEIYNATSPSSVAGDYYFVDTGMAPGTTRYYTVWTYNETANLYSLLNSQEATETTDTPNAAPTLSNPSPSDGATIAYTTTQTVSIDISDAEGDSITGYINCSGDNQAISGGNNTYSNSLSGLSAGTYTWYVNVTDGNSWTRDSYTFTINAKPSGGGGGGGWNPSPANSAPSVSVNAPLSVDVYDADGDFVTVKFYWSDDTLIGSDTDPDGDGTVSVSPATLDYDTTYNWYVVANDSLDTTTSPTWTFDTASLGVDIDAAWTAHATNNTIFKWVNVTNTGSENLTNVDIWDRPSTYLSLDEYNHDSDFSANGHYEWTIPYLNYTGENTYYNITMWFSLDSRPFYDNDQCFYNLINVSHLGQTDSVNLTGLCYSFDVDKTSNITFVNETQTEVGWTISIENTGDFTLNNVYINETYDSCVNYSSSTITPENPGTDTVFLISSIAPAATSDLIVNISVTSGCPENGTRIYNNATVNTTQLTSEISLSEYIPYGGYTEQIRVDYNIQINDMNELGFTMQTILGILMIVGAILLIIGMMYKSGYIGGGEGQ